MSKFDYSGLSGTATNLIYRFGKAFTHRVITQSGTEWNPTIATVDTSIDGVLTAYKQNEVDGTLILSSDKKLITKSLVALDDKIIDNGKEYTVMSVNILSPADTILLYTVQLRGA